MLINHTLKNINQGVSQQHSEARQESQVEEMINCIPDISRGIFRRNPFTTTSATSDTFTANPNFYAHSFSIGEDKYSLQINNNNQLTVLNTTTGATLLAPVTSSYLAVAGGDTYNNVYDSFQAITVKDFTFIVNRNTNIAMSATVDGTANSELDTAVYWIKDISAFVTDVQTEGTIDSNTTVSNYEGHTYTLNGTSVTGTREYTWNSGTSTFDLTTDQITAEGIASKLATDLGAGYTAAGPFVYWTGTGQPTNWDWGDTSNDTASFGFNGEVADASNLPAFIDDAVVDYYNTNKGGLFVYVSGGTDDDIGYWLEYSKGIGWKESRKPGMTNTLDATTMPHVLVRDNVGNFHFTTYTTAALQAIPGLTDTELGWKNRLYGDNTTSVLPSFIGNPITDMVFYQNRLGFLSLDSILFSEVNVYGNFFPTSIRAFLESDSIDITIATTDISILRYMVEFSDRLIIFSDTTQYSLGAIRQNIYDVSGALGASSSSVTTISKYNINTSVKPRIVGDKLYFLSKIGTSEHLYAYSKSSKVADKFVSVDVTAHTPTYISTDIFQIVGQSTLGYVVMSSYNDNTLYIYNGTSYGDEQVQSAIHKWELPLPILSTSIIDNSLHLTMFDSTTNTIITGTIGLNTPSDFSVVSYTDDVNTVDTNYNSDITFSEWNIKQEGFGNTRGRLQVRTIKYSIAELSKYTTTITNKDLQLVTFDSLIKTGLWDDTGTWCDACPWIDGGYKFSRNYTDDDTITVMANSQRNTIKFSNSVDNPTAGFNLHTLNYEGFYYQRSRRY